MSQAPDYTLNYTLKPVMVAAYKSQPLSRDLFGVAVAQTNRQGARVRVVLLDESGAVVDEFDVVGEAADR